MTNIGPGMSDSRCATEAGNQRGISSCQNTNTSKLHSVSANVAISVWFKCVEMTLTMPNTSAGMV